MHHAISHLAEAGEDASHRSWVKVHGVPAIPILGYRI
jgi:hypothetical protein